MNFRTKYLIASIFLIVSSLTYSQKETIDGASITNGAQVYLKHAKVFITPPSGYNFIEEYASFINYKSNTSISVVKKEALDYNQFIQAVKSNTEHVKSFKEINGGMLFILNFSVKGRSIDRLMFVKPIKKGLIYSLANYISTDKEKYKEVLLKSILSIK